MADQTLTAAQIAAIENNIANVWSLSDYIAFLNGDDVDGGLVTDLDHWKTCGITTAAELADYIGGCHERNMEKSERH